MRGWCPVCHPNQRQMGAYKTFMAGQALSQVGCLITLIVFVLIPMIIILYACATA